VMPVTCYALRLTNMFSLTPRERKVLVFLGILIFCGAVLRFLNVKINNVTASANNQNQIQEALLININTASSADLEKITGIGPAIAGRIIEYRKAHGNFSSLDDLRKVKGIGGKKLKIMKDYITIQDRRPKTEDYRPEEEGSLKVEGR